MLGKSDLFIHMNIIGEFIEAVHRDKPSTTAIEDYIYEYAKARHLLPKSLKEVYYNLNQLSEILETIIKDNSEKTKLSKAFIKYTKPTPQQQSVLLEIIIACFIDQCARRITYLDDEGR